MEKVRIPTIIALFLLLFGIVGGVILIRQGPEWFLRASPEITPKQVKITNITESGFSVSWITDGQTSGFVKYGSDLDLTMTAGDDRDQLSGKTGSFTIHHISISNLKPSTRYYFKIGSGNNLFENNGQSYQVTTAPTIGETAPANDVAYGVIVDQNGAPTKGAIVYLSLANAIVLSTITKSSGNWVIPLNLARSSDLSSYASYDHQASIEEIFVQAGSLGTATAVTVTKYDSPVSTISLGQSYDFRAGQGQKEVTQAPTETITQESTSGSKFTLESLITPSPKIKLAIINPDEGEEINTQKPEILGTAPPAKKINITIQSPATLSGTTLVDAKGNWKWTPPTNLETGQHTVTASFIDENGKQQKISRAFTVLAAGGSELPAIISTPSATASPSATPTPTPISRVSMPSTATAVPTAGDLTPTFFVSILGLILVFSGIVFSILSRKQTI